MTPARDAEAILIDRAERDFEEGLAHARSRIRETNGRIAGAALDALVMSAVTTLGARARIRHDVRDLLAIARRVAAGEDARTLAEAHLDDVLRLKQKMHLVARVDDPAFAEVRGIALELFAKRLPDLARLASVESPTDYDDLVRKAYPRRDEVDALVDDNARELHRMIDHIDAHPHLLRAPQKMVHAIAGMAREFTAWKVDAVRAGVDEIYADQVHE